VDIISFWKKAISKLIRILNCYPWFAISIRNPEGLMGPGVYPRTSGRKDMPWAVSGLGV
jgi:hypothetical protein